MRKLFPLVALLSALLPATAVAAPSDDALAALREMRMLNYRIQTRYHVGTLTADAAPFENLRQDVERFDNALIALQDATRRGHLHVQANSIAERWQAVRWFATQDLPVPSTEILPKEITYDRARRPASVAAIKIAGQQLAAALMNGMMAIPAPQESPAHIDFALAALELQYIAYRYADLAGIDPLLDISGEPALPVLESAFVQRVAAMELRYGNSPEFTEPMRVLRASWLFIQPALSRAREAPVPVLVSRYAGLATDAMLPVFAGDIDTSAQETPEIP